MSADLMSLQESGVADTGAVQEALCPICAIPRGYRSLSNTRWASRPWTLRLDRTAAEYHSNTHGYQKAMRDSGQAGSGDSENMSSGCSLRRLLSRRLPTLALWLLAQIPGPFLSRLVPLSCAGFDPFGRQSRSYSLGTINLSLFGGRGRSDGGRQLLKAVLMGQL